MPQEKEFFIRHNQNARYIFLFLIEPKVDTIICGRADVPDSPSKAKADCRQKISK